MTSPDRPLVLYSAAMTIDGKIASKTGNAELSDDTDWREVHAIRKDVDAVIVGVETVLKDDPKLRVKFHEGLDKYPARVVVDSSARTPPESQVVKFQRERYQTYIFTSATAPEERTRALEGQGARVISTNRGSRVDLVEMLSRLHQLGMRKVMLEGGGTLAWGFLEADLIDELRLFVAPYLCGGREATSLVMGAGFLTIPASRRFTLLSARTRGDFLVLKYKRKRP
ncbi:MAG: 2,5-diamino-6-(ribosylamino)-4(3H)-pyrimidinone 5'-phosphate reductase [Promethearchaeota archaeon]